MTHLVAFVSGLVAHFFHIFHIIAQYDCHDQVMSSCTLHYRISLE